MNASTVYRKQKSVQYRVVTVEGRGPVVEAGPSNFQASFNLKEILCMAKATQTTELHQVESLGKNMAMIVGIVFKGTAELSLLCDIVADNFTLL